jgi:hypothetical protein
LINEQNITALTFKKYALPLVNGLDLKITATDSQIDANGKLLMSLHIQE